MKEIERLSHQWPASVYGHGNEESELAFSNGNPKFQHPLE
jgi:hypothetical protein